MCCYYYVMFFTLNLFAHQVFGGCPFATATQPVNFSGDWSFNDTTANGGKPVVFHICHLPTNEVYLTQAMNDTPLELIGFGRGNYSAHTSLVYGTIDNVHNLNISHSVFVLGMNTDTHQWWFEDDYRSVPVIQHKKGLFGAETCALPFGTDVRLQHWSEYLMGKRIFYRHKRRIKKLRNPVKRRLNPKKKKEEKSDTYVSIINTVSALINEYILNPLLDIFGGMNNSAIVISEKEKEMKIAKELDQYLIDYELPSSMLDVDVQFQFMQKPNFPSLIGSQWIGGGENVRVRFMDDGKQVCAIVGSEVYAFSNVTSVYFGAAIIAFEEEDESMKSTAFFVQSGAESMLTVLMSVEGSHLTMNMVKDLGDEKLECARFEGESQKKCLSGEHCEL